MHVAMHVNRIEARWERALTATDVLARADAALDSQTAKVRKADPDRFVEIEQDHYLLDLPYAFGPSDRSITLQERELSGLVLNAVRGRIAEVTFSLRRVDDDAVQQFRASLRARWGQPRVKGDTWAWTKPDRMIEAESVDGEWLRITIRSRLPAS